MVLSNGKDHMIERKYEGPELIDLVQLVCILIVEVVGAFDYFYGLDDAGMISTIP
jgi:hypothetical protein